MRQLWTSASKGMLFFIFNFSMLIFAQDVHAQVTLFKFGKDADLKLAGEITARHTYENWFQSDPAPADNDYQYFFTRSRLSVSFQHPYVGAYVQAQDVHMWNLPQGSIAPLPQGPLGMGATYNLHSGSDTSSSTIVRQAYLDLPRFFVKNLSLRIGRFDYADGKEVLYKDPKVNWLKNMRLSDRLIGPFDWSSYNRSFDGLQVTYNGKGFHLHASATHPTQGGFENDAHKTISAIDLVTATATIKYGEWLKNTEARFFFYHYNDNRRITSTPGQSGLHEGNIRINTFGTHWLRTESTKRGVADMLLWAALQEGEWGAVDHRAWALALEGGFQFTKTAWQPWVRGGFFVSSGDSDPTDGEHRTFYQLLPTARKYAFFPFYNLMNNEDLFIQVILKPTAAMTLRADLHSLNLHEPKDLWYMGAGPTQSAGRIFGYTGRPGNGLKDLATVLDIAPSYTFNKYLSVNLYYGKAFGKDVIKRIYNADSNGDLFFMEMKAQF